MQMSKVLDTLNEKYGNKLLAMKVDISLKENMNIAAQYNVQYVPHLLFVDGKGEVVNQGVGYMPEEDVLLAFEEAGIKIK